MHSESALVPYYSCEFRSSERPNSSQRKHENFSFEFSEDEVGYYSKLFLTLNKKRKIHLSNDAISREIVGSILLSYSDVQRDVFIGQELRSALAYLPSMVSFVVSIFSLFVAVHLIEGGNGWYAISAMIFFVGMLFFSVLSFWVERKILVHSRGG
ncbi:hypothetical protein GH722_13995 [Alphaproteobacteria bacterium HT1-32]|nr:hypothetical protein [Alphaproteobacteria bacterium HT1-32]